MFLINNLQLVENMYLFQKVEDISEYTSFSNTFNEFTLKCFWHIIICSLGRLYTVHQHFIHIFTIGCMQNIHRLY